MKTRVINVAAVNSRRVSTVTSGELQRQQPQQSLSQQPSSSAATKRRVTTMCIVIATCYTLTSLLGNINVTLLAVGNDVLRAVYYQLVTLRTFGCCLDPFVYGLMWRPFRKSLLEVKIHNRTLFVTPVAL